VQREPDRPVLLRPGEGETIFDGPERTIRILADREELTLTWFCYEPGQEGPVPHVHRRHTDAFYVLEGELELGLGPELTRVTGRAGTLAAAPPNLVHTFRNASDATVVFLNVHAPSMGFAEMLRAARVGRDEEAEEFDQFEPPGDGGRPLSDAALRGAGEGEKTTNGGTSSIVKAEASDVDGFFSLTETTFEPGFRGPVPNRHRMLVDCFYVLESTLSLQVGGEWIEAGTGAFGLLTPGTVHAFVNRSEHPVRMLNFMAPGGFEPSPTAS
jgi:quercetin dioxygenase-like cupin family protein